MARKGIPHIGLYGQCGFGNFGNDATLEVVLGHLRRTLPGMRFTAIVRVPPVVEANLAVRAIPFYPPARFPPHGEAGPLRVLSRLANEVIRIGEAAKQIKTLDYVVFAGGGRFDDFNAEPLQQPFWKWKWISLARLFGVPVEYVAIGAGPVDHPLSRWFYRASGNMAHSRSFRDDESRRYAHDILRIDTSQDQVFTDLVFARRPPIAARPPTWPARTIGIGVMEYSNRRGDKGGPDDIYPSYIARLTELASKLLSRGCDVRILIGETCDMSTAIDLYRRLAGVEGGRVTLNPTTSYGEVAAEAAKCDAIIATRYHNVVAALSAGRPVFSIGYASKNERLMEEFGLGDFCARVETFDANEVLMRFDRLLERGPLHAARIAMQARDHARIAQSCLDNLTTRITAAVEQTARAPQSGEARPRPSRTAPAR